jgi:hypothetical protein
MANGGRSRIISRMGGSYAAIWTHRHEKPHVGSVELVDGGVHLFDSSPHNRDDRLVGFGEIEGVRMGTTAERLADLKTLVVETVSGQQVRIAVLGLGAAVELAQLLSESLPG